MKVLFDHQIFSLQKYGGISRYFVELQKKFDKMSCIESMISLKYSDNEYIKDYKRKKVQSFFTDRNFRGKGRIFSSLNKRENFRDIKRYKPDLIHPTYYHDLYEGYSNKFVISIMDMIDEKFNKDSSPYSNKLIENRLKLCSEASAVLTISESSKIDIVNIMGIPSDKVHVVYLSGSELGDESDSRKIDTPEKFILFVGNRTKYKNFKNALEAYSKIDKKENCYLYCAGGGAFTELELEQIRKLRLDSYVIQKNVYDLELRYLYENAQFFIFPSLYEGFGIPVLESFASDCPLLVSDRSSLPEIAGDGGLYINPEDVNDIYEKMMILLKDDTIRNQLVLNGNKQRKKFSWDLCARQTLDVYKKVLDD